MTGVEGATGCETAGCVTAGVGGGPGSLAAADWAAREALSRGTVLRLVHAWDQPSAVLADAVAGVVPPPDRDRSAALLAAARDTLARRYPGLTVTTESRCGPLAAALTGAGADGGLLVLGSRGSGRATGLLLGSLARAAVARSGRPVVLVRPGDDEDRTGQGDVVVGVGPAGPDDTVLGFAFDAASRRTAPLRVVHGDDPAGRTRQRLTEALRAWQDKYPDVRVARQPVVGTAAAHLVDAARDACLLVVGRTGRRPALATHIGPVTDAVLQHATAPVAVVPHG
ncbi:universal stress protein [Streptomyces sp. LP11]|uniref:Universal stress protein n=1 Tax=Streptomyces pyxinicus TaxID=2970331 RepID=A0ABT2B6R4_9ACTN|nr:universal stress protein [Streptomyces sp. LP11]MCS0604210.1 universal stress protein [Streptomyces sp. LP11]